MTMTSKSIVNYIVENIDPEEYYSEIFDDINWGASDEARVHSPFIEERTPSLSINRVTGAWYSFCKSDEHGGSNLVTFHAALHQMSILDTCRKLCDEWIRPIISDRLIRKWHRNLLETPSILKWILNRKISMEIIKQYRIGWNDSRIMIPVYNEYNLCVNSRMYDLTHKKGSDIPKVIHYTQENEERSYGSPPVIFPVDQLMNEENKRILVCEGEWDVFTALTLGIPAVTSSSGAKSWPKEYNYMFAGKDVVICYDNDETGKDERKRPAQNLSSIAKTLSVFDIPPKYGKDLNDYVKARGITKKNQLIRDIDRLEIISENDQCEIIDNPVDIMKEISLDKASNGKLYGKILTVNALVTGKSYPSFLLPTKYRVICNQTCEGCKVAIAHLGFIEKTIDSSNPNALSMIEIPKNTLRSKLLLHAGIDKANCKAKIEIAESVNIEKLQLIPTLDVDSTDYTRQMAYCVGHGVKPNRLYQFIGTLCPHPKTQGATLLFSAARPIQDEIETFKMSPEIKEQLNIFKAKKGEVNEKIHQMAEWDSNHITNIYDRPDLHITISLVFCSPLSFKFNNELVHKGGLDVLVIGDTRTGKGFVTERLCKYYRAGDVASGESCTQRGLVGACQKMDGEWIITWGMFPLNHKRLVVIDELSSLLPQQISELTRIRSEGIAEIVKVVRESTPANLRIISLSNPRSGRPLCSYNSGPEAVKELIGANEDISRFDFILSVASDEVDSKIINSIHTSDDSDLSAYPQDACRHLIFWIWSRRPDQIKFSKAAVKRIINVSNRLGKMYSSTIPIVQAENIRFKLAKMSAAVAGRVFSSDSKGEILEIHEEHVLFAVKFMIDSYNKPSFGYDVYSKMSQAASKVAPTDSIIKMFKKQGLLAEPLITGILELQRITTDNLADYCGDPSMAKMIISELVQLRCLYRIEKLKAYMKNPQFTTILREIECQFKKTKK